MYLRIRLQIAFLFLFLFGGILPGLTQIPNFKVVDLSRHFKAKQVTGSITLFHLESNTWISSDDTDWNVGTLPASTFKVVNSLIALEAKAIPDEKEIISYPGHDTTKYGVRKDIRHAMDLGEAIERSVVWYYLILAERVGCENYPTYLNRIPYGNGKIFCQEELDFWNFGEYKITPAEQIMLLVRLYRENLPFEKRHQQTVKRILINQGFENYTVRAKTGWTRAETEDIGWWIGYVESAKGTWFFATRIKSPEDQTTWDFARYRKDITLDILLELDAMPEE